MTKRLLSMTKRLLSMTKRLLTMTKRLLKGDGRFVTLTSRFVDVRSRFAALRRRLVRLVGRFSGVRVAVSSPGGRFSAVDRRVMSHTKQAVMERSGLANRTIRNYIARGLLPPPQGHGLAAKYDEEHMTRAIAIGRMRAQGQLLDAIIERIEGWTPEQFERFVEETEPKGEAALDAQGAAGEPVTYAALDERPGERSLAELSELPDAPAWRIYPLVTGLNVMVDTAAPAIVQRIAGEILAKYGAHLRA